MARPNVLTGRWSKYFGACSPTVEYLIHVGWSSSPTWHLPLTVRSLQLHKRPPTNWSTVLTCANQLTTSLPRQPLASLPKKPLHVPFAGAALLAMLYGRPGSSKPGTTIAATPLSTSLRVTRFFSLLDIFRPKAAKSLRRDRWGPLGSFIMWARSLTALGCHLDGLRFIPRSTSLYFVRG